MGRAKGIKKKGGVYCYLNSTKVLETGTEQAIIEARKAYWKAYKAAWRKEQRTSKKEFVVVLTENEANRILAGAQKHRLSPTRYIKASCFAYLAKQYLPLDPLALATIRQLLAMNYAALQKLFDESRVPFETGRAVLSQMAELETNVTKELYNPKELNE